MSPRTLLLLLLASCGAACPPGCHCGSKGGRDYYSCEVDGARYSVEGTGQRGSTTTIECVKDFEALTCQNLRDCPLAFDGSLSRLIMKWCDIPVLECAAARLGAAAVTEVMLEHPHETLRPEHLAGLQGVQTLRLEHAASETSVPYGALSTLPSLREFYLHNAKVTLSPPPAASSLHLLDLNANGIRSLPAHVFTNLPNLTELRLYSNQICNISVDAFKGLSLLTKLDLSQNPVCALQAGTFRHTPLLTGLRLESAQLQHLRPGLLTGLEHLAYIEIMEGGNLTLHDLSFSALPALERLIISDTHLGDLPSDLLSSSSAMQSIELTACGLRAIPDQLFRDQGDLKTLNLNYNKIETLPPKIFQPLGNLTHLDLSNNLIKTLPAKLLSGQNKLLTFDASCNDLTSIDTTAFYGANKLQRVTLRVNRLTLLPATQEEINSSPFSYLTELQELDLGHNMIPLVLDDWRVSLIHKIRLINLTHNHIADLKGNDIQFFGPHLTVDFRHNRITTIKLPDKPLNDATLLLGDNPYNCDCNLYPVLNYTRKSKTKLKLDQATCAAPQSLKLEPLNTLPLAALSCSIPDCPNNCNCSVYPATSFISIDCVYPPNPLHYPKPAKYNLTNINLRLKHLDKPLELPIEVVSLNVSHTNLTTIPELPTTLKVIDLSSNQLATIPQAISQRNVTLYIANNPLECICAYKDDFKVLFDSESVKADLEEASCMDGEPVKLVNASHLCDIWWAAVLGGLLAVIGLMLAASASFIYFYNMDIKRFIYKQGWNLFIYEEEIDGKRYDVLVSYADDQEKIVVKKIVPALVRQGFKVTARYKDWDIGDFIPAKVAGLVEDSRRTLVILTRSYLESIARLEMSAARLYESRQKRKRMLVVVMDEAEFDRQDPLVDNRRCLMWQDPRFWEQLKKEMPRRRERKEERKVNQVTLNVLMTSRGNVLFQCDKPV